MVYKVVLMMLISIFFGAFNGRADDISMIKDIDESIDKGIDKNADEDMDKNIKKDQLINKELIQDPKKTEITVSDEKKLENDAARDFIDLQNEKLRQIKILDLELKRADLELKQKEIQSKLTQFDQEINVGKTASENVQDMSHMAIGLKGILSFSEEPQAILIVNNKQVMVKTGGLVADHFTVIRIDHESIVLKDTSGLEKVLMVGEFL